MSTFETAVELRSYRAASEDRAAVVPLAGGVLLVVADGVGGRRGGARAAERAVEFVAAAAPAVARPWDPGAWTRVLRDADAALNADPDAGETTLVAAAAVADRGVAGASVGDSEAWVISADRSVPLTDRSGKPYLGFGMAVPVGFQEPDLDGTLLVATDGLFKNVSVTRFAAAARHPDLAEAARAVAELPRNPAGSFYDDVAVVLCRARPGP